MILKTSKGEVTLKDRLTVRDFYSFQCAESSAMKMNTEGVTLDGDAVNKLKELKVIAVIEKIVIEQKEREINMDTLLNDDYFDIKDFEKVFTKALEHAISLQTKSTPSKKS